MKSPTDISISGQREAPGDVTGLLATGFTLIELMVVVGIFTLLTSLFLPALGAARSSARTTQCASNLHQLSIAFFEYMASASGKLPPNVSSPLPGMFWYDDDRLGKFLPSSRPRVPTGKYGGNVYICPGDPDPALLSYSMNVWASSEVDSSVAAPPVSECVWSSNSLRSAKLILLTESYSQIGSSNTGWFAPATIGTVGSSCLARFGTSGGIAPPLNAKRWGYINCELDFMRHRLPNNNAKYTQPKGRLNIAYADGHVALKSDTDLVNQQGALTGDSYWSPMDWGGR